MAAKSKSRNVSSKQLPSAAELLVLELQEIHSAESQLSRMLPRIAKAVESNKLREMIEQRQEQGERLLKELETSFDELDESPGRKKNIAAEGLVNDLREHMQELDDGPGLDTVLIAGLQKTEHYCIAAWGTARALAEAGDQSTVVASMERALKEGKAFDEQLTELAEEEVTPALIAGEEDEEDEEGEDDETEAGRGSKAGSKSGRSGKSRPERRAS